MANDNALMIRESPEAEIIHKQLEALSPRFAAVLGKIMQPERMIRTILISLDRLPALYGADRQSLFNAAMSAACLGLEVDGVTGQAFLIPFKGKAQLVIGYKGYSTMGARSGYSIRGAVVRAGDVFEYEPTNIDNPVLHRPKAGNDGRIVGAWALALSHTLPSLPSFLSIDELMDVKKRSPGAARRESPWNDPAIGFIAMCEKTAKRRLARGMPLNVIPLAASFHYAARMDEAVEEQGKPAWIVPVQDGENGARTVIVDAETIESPIPEMITSPAPETFSATTSGEFSDLPADTAQKAAALKDYLTSADSVRRIDSRYENSKTQALLQQIKILSEEDYKKLLDVYEKQRAKLSEAEESARNEGA